MAQTTKSWSEQLKSYISEIGQFTRTYARVMISDLTISGFCDPSTRSKFYRDRLLALNVEQFNNINISFANGSLPDLNIDVYDGSYPLYKDFATDIQLAEKSGTDNPQVEVAGDYTYSVTNAETGTLGGDIYQATANNFYGYEKNGSGAYGSFTNKITITQNGILDKTERLFDLNRMSTIVSAFHTRPTANIPVGSAVSRYGMSHGRNLLTEEAEKTGLNIPSYGNFDNPYCRVWTHQYQYDNISKLIRPFVDDSGQPVSIGELQGDWTFIRGETGAERLNEYSVLNKNGFVNITPSYGDKDSKVETRKTMFSIENLAWKGVDPYAFEQALSWEQRGPMGGRIMWFPPYDIEFSENVNVNWNKEGFIGRGEKVPTYIDTDRSGTLNFSIVVDHPSIVNYYEGDPTSLSVSNTGSGTTTPTSGNTTVGRNGIAGLTASTVLPTTISAQATSVPGGKRDTSLLRFFAGCGDLSGAVRAKFLTDEYTKTVTENVTSSTKDITDIPTPIIKEEEVPNTVDEIYFYVFYPNNYTGYYDSGGTVEPIAYLLNGAVCQKQADDEDVPIGFDDLYNHACEDGVGTGYEMTAGVGVSSYDSGNYLYSQEDMQIHATSQFGTDETWQYRIDGRITDSYVRTTDWEANAAQKDGTVTNCYSQKLYPSSNYIDQSNYASGANNTLNANIATILEVSSSEDEEKLYSLGEIAYVISQNESAKAIIKDKLDGAGITDLDERLERLQNLFDSYEVESVEILGYANSHGSNATQSLNDARNRFLATQRAVTVKKWLQNKGGRYFTDDKINAKINQVTDSGNAGTALVTNDDVSEIHSKFYRHAKAVIKFSTSNSKKVAETQQTTTDDDGNQVIVGMQEYVGYNPIGDGKYKDADGNIWTLREDGTMYRTDTETGTTSSVTVEERSLEHNETRYDQEYHFFKVRPAGSKINQDRLIDKLLYFEPLLHGMTPEGLNMRLTFLQQCTRQANTVGASDAQRQTATNLAFGCPPICVLRLGDFFYCYITITNVTVNYENQWDLNTEGIGVQPMIARVSLNFDIYGGADIAGPIRRLQNANTFNYYANTEVYDNRADRVTYPSDPTHTYDSGEAADYTAYLPKMASK